MATDYLEFLHISQFYETIMMLVILIPLAMQIMLFRHKLWFYINEKRIEQRLQYEKSIQLFVDEPDTQIQRQIQQIESSNRRNTQSVAMENEGGQQNAQGQNRQEPTPSQLNNHGVRNSSINPQSERPQFTPDQTRVMHFHEQIGDVYQKHLPVIMVIITISILNQNCEVFSLAMFFAYVIANLMLDYAEMYQQLKTQYQDKTIAPFVNLVSCLIMIAIFINLFARSEYNLNY